MTERLDLCPLYKPAWLVSFGLIYFVIIRILLQFKSFPQDPGISMTSVPPAEIARQKAHINDNRSSMLITVCNVFTGIALLSVVARLSARRLARATLGLDDYLAIGTLVYSSAMGFHSVA